MGMSSQQRNIKINEFFTIAEEKGLDYLIENHFKEIVNVSLTELEWYRIAKADPEANQRLSQLPFNERAIILERALNPHGIHSVISHKTPTFGAFKEKPTPHPDIFERDGSGVLYLESSVFQSWDRSVSNLPKYTFFPKSKAGIQNIIKWAKIHEPNLSIRASGYRHTCTDIYSEDNGILISMLDYETALRLPAKHPAMDPNNDLQGIQLLHEIEEDGETKMLCKIGASTCNFHFQRWVHDPQGGNFKWALPLNVIMTEITFGGSNGPVCHGGGLHNKTLSDLVTEIEYIDISGKIHTIKDPKLLKSLSGAFGMFGIITSLTLKLDKMTYANLYTVDKEPLYIAIPPPSYADIPEHLKPYITPKIYKQARLDFINRAENHYYAEWFWFPLQPECWVNTWNNDGDPKRSIRYPSHAAIEWHEAEAYIAQLANMSLFKSGLFTGKQQANLLGKVSMASLPDRKDRVCTIEDAEHFRHGIQNTRQRMVEFEIGIPGRKDDPNKPDWTMVQKLWWDVINVVNHPKNQKDFPMRTTLEMRVMSGSDVLMAPQHGNKWTCAIEILTVPMVENHIWMKFAQEVLDTWSKHTKPDGSPLNIRPHWAKGFGGLKMGGMPIYDYLKNVSYKNEIPEFVQALTDLAKKDGYSVREMKKFSNPTLRQFFWEPNKLALKDKKAHSPIKYGDRHDQSSHQPPVKQWLPVNRPR